ncbi:MAG: 5-(carboxyamino)imidazole ribonucleotide synthase [Gammaproteobacteria bacterium]|jgi:5-(carboxyamino)imidazole ribonucleotide synthase
MRIGIVGGGQLGRMLGLAGIPLGLEFVFLDPGDEPPASAVGDIIPAPFDDREALELLAKRCDILTYEFENVDVDSLQAAAADSAPVFPTPRALATAQDRKSEKLAFEAAGIPVAPWRAVASHEELRDAGRTLGLPLVVKTRRFGYDGKGQYRIQDPSDVDAAWAALGGVPLLAERFVEFEREVSALGVRGGDGSLAAYPLTENVHRGGILHTSRAPLDDVELQAQADRCLRALTDELDYRGTIAIEFFVVAGQLYGNEFAPRVHNSGHWTIEGAVCSQFENHLRAICGVPLGACRPRGHAGMVNLVGTMPPVASLLELPDVHLHDYHKEARPGRKLGHVTGVAASPGERDRIIDRIETLLA